MLPLKTPHVPTNSEELAAALTAGLGEMFELPPRGPVVAVEGGFPVLDRLHIDLTGAVARRDYRPAPPNGTREGRLSVRHLEIVGQPVRHAAASLFVRLRAQEAHLESTRDEAGRSILLPVDAAAGHLATRIDRADLEALVLAELRHAAREHGVTIEQSELRLTGAGRSLGVQLSVTASKKVLLVVRTTVRGQGRLTLDDALNATVSDLSCHGEGMIGALVTGMVQQHLRAWEGRTIPLTAFALGKLRLKDLRLNLEQGLDIEADLAG